MFQQRQVSSRIQDTLDTATPEINLQGPSSEPQAKKRGKTAETSGHDGQNQKSLHDTKKDLI